MKAGTDEFVWCLINHPMRLATVTIALLGFSFLAGDSFAQRKNAQSPPILGIINARAIELPKPAYTEELKTLCASGEVRLEVLVGESGNILEAKAVSGDELLHEASVAAVKGAKFQPYDGPPIRARGIIVYNFPLERRCVDVGNVNGKWMTPPNFSIHPHAIVRKKIGVHIRVAIDVHSGKVIAAKAIGGHPLIRTSLEKQALQIKFYPTIVNSATITAKGIIKLTIYTDRSVKF